MMRQGAEAAAARAGARLLTGAGKHDGDNAGQVTALENMVAAGARVVMITVSDAKAIVPAVRRARARGVLVIALDSPPDPADAVDAVFATDNYKAGTLIGRYARAALGSRPARIATIDCLPGHPVGAQRTTASSPASASRPRRRPSTQLGRPPQVVCAADSYGDQTRGRRRWRTACRRTPTSPSSTPSTSRAPAGAARAVRAAGRAGRWSSSPSTAAARGCAT
jgi:fructose transport system substrate-binding protein